MMRHLILLCAALVSFSCLEAKGKVKLEQTLSIIKPDAVADNHIGDIVTQFERSGLQIVAMKMVRLKESQAKRFYEEHQSRPFYNDLVTFMTSGPVITIVLEGENAIAKNRKIMGVTDPKKADPGTIRRQFAKSIESNAVHGSDSPESAKREVAFFFKPQEIHGAKKQAKLAASQK